MAIDKSQIKVDHIELKRRQQLSLEEKISWSCEAYIEFFEIFHAKGFYIAFSGGKDSQVLADVIDQLHDGKLDKYLSFSALFLKRYLKINPTNKPPKVFCDTGLEFPEIRKHVKSFSNVTFLKPKMLWTDVVKEHGFLIGSKKISRMVFSINNPTGNNENTRTLYLTGIKSDGTKSNDFKLPIKWRKLINAPFNVSEKCCDVFKKNPFAEYEKKTKRLPIVGTTAAESNMRRISYMKTGCNSFDKDPKSRPLSIWTDQDIWEYSRLMEIRFCEVYYSREVEYMENDGNLIKVQVNGEKQTGCIFCLTGSEKEIEKRFNRLKTTHPKQYNFLMDGKVKMRSVLEHLGIASKLF